MQTLSSSLTANLIDIDARLAPRVLVDVFELYDPDYVPGVSGFDPADAAETFAGQEITHNGIAYRREVVSRGDITKSMTEKTNSVNVEFSNITRYLATLAQSQTIEGMFLVIRCIVPAVTDDDIVLFVGRCEKPSDIDKQSFNLSARQDFGNINQTLPPRKFTAQDPEGRLPSDPLFEGIQFIAVAGSNQWNTVGPESGIGGLFGRRDDIPHSRQWSSIDGTPYGQVINEIFGRCQMRLVPFAFADKGLFVTYLMAISAGPIAGATEIISRTEGFSHPFNLPGPIGAVVHLGDPGGTGTNTGNTNQADLGAGGKFSHLAYIEGASTGSLIDQDDTPPVVTALVRGRIVPLPDGSGVYNQTGWTDNAVHISRFILTHPSFVNINPGFMEDAVNYLTSLHCDAPMIDETNDQMILVQSADLPEAGDMFRRFRATGILDPRYHTYYDYDAGIAPEFVDGPYDEWLPEATVFPTYATQKLLRKRYTCNIPITDEVRAVDFLYKTIFPSAKLFLRINKYGRYEIHTEKPSDNTYLRANTAVGDVSVPVLDVTPWKTGPLLLQGRILLGFNQTTSEVRNVQSAVFSTSGNAVTLVASKTGTIVVTASGATLSGGSTTVQASGTITLSGTLTIGDTITATIDGIAVTYTLADEETLTTAAQMLSGYINATPRLQKFISATSSGAVITITCLHGALTLDSALLKTHVGPIVDPLVAPTVAASAGALPAGNYKVAYSDVGTLGETAITPLASITIAINQQIDVSGLPAFPAGITARNFYLSEVHDSTIIKFAVTRTNTSDFSINAVPLPNASLPPAFNKTADELIRIAMSFSTNSQDVIPGWRPGVVTLVNDLLLPTNANNHKYQCTFAGTTGLTEPTFPTGAGATVADNGVIWTEIGPTYLGQAGLTRANVKKDSFKWPLGSRQASVNQCKISYRSAKDDFALVPYRINDPVHQAQVKKVLPIEVDGSAIDNFHQMYRIGNWVLAKNREGDWFMSMSTGPQGLVLEEGDLVCGSDDSGGLVNVVGRAEEIRIHANHDVTISQARKYSTNQLSDDVRADAIAIATTLRFAAIVNSVVQFLDTAPTRDADAVTPGFYVVVSRPLLLEGEWRGWSLHVDFGDGYTFLVEGDLAGTMGVTTTTLAGVSDPTAYDVVNTVTFTIQYGARPLGFTNATQAELDANPYRNLFLIGNEYVQASTIVDNGSDSYTLSNLYRGRISSWGKVYHRSGERVIHMNGAEVFVPMNSVRRGIPYNYKPVTTNQDVADASAVSFTWSGGTYRPAAPKNITVYRDAYELASASAGQVQLSVPLRKTRDAIQQHSVDVYKATVSGTFTVDASTNVFTATSHGMVDGHEPAFSTTGILPSPLQLDEHYLVRDVTTHTFKLARTLTGAAIDILDTGTGTHSYSKRLRHMPVIQGTVNPVLVDNFDDTITTAGSGGWLETITSTYFVGAPGSRNTLYGTASFPVVRVFNEITQPGFFTEFSIATIARELASQVIAISFANPANAASLTNAYYQMHFELIIILPVKYGPSSRRWQMKIKESVTGASPTTVYTSPDYELPDTRYRIQISGSEVRFFRNYAGLGSEHIFRSTIPAQYPMSMDASMTTKGSFLNVTAGGRPEFVTTYPADDQIADTGTTPPPATFRYRVYEQRTFQDVTYDGDATDFIT